MSTFRTQLVIAVMLIMTKPASAWWQPLSLVENIRSIGYASGWYFFMTDKGLYRTDDPLRTQIWQMVSKPIAMQTPFVTMGGCLFTRTSSGYVTSTNLGVSWVATPQFPYDAPSDRLLSSDRYLFILQRSKLHRSSDLGYTWESIDLSQYAGLSLRRMFTILPSGIGYAQGTDFSMWETVDNGEHWTQVRQPAFLGFGNDVWVSNTGVLYEYDRPSSSNDTFFNAPYLAVSHDGGRTFNTIRSTQDMGAHAFADAGNTVLIAATEYGWSFFYGDWTRDGIIRSQPEDAYGRTWVYTGSPFDHSLPYSMVTAGGCVFATASGNRVYAYQFKQTVTDVESNTDIQTSCAPEIRRDLDHMTVINPCAPFNLTTYTLLGQHIADHEVPTGTTHLPITMLQFYRIMP